MPEQWIRADIIEEQKQADKKRAKKTNKPKAAKETVTEKQEQENGQ